MNKIYNRVNQEYQKLDDNVVDKVVLLDKIQNSRKFLILYSILNVW